MAGHKYASISISEVCLRYPSLSSGKACDGNRQSQSRIGLNPSVDGKSTYNIGCLDASCMLSDVVGYTLKYTRVYMFNRRFICTGINSFGRIAATCRPQALEHHATSKSLSRTVCAASLPPTSHPPSATPIKQFSTNLVSSWSTPNRSPVYLLHLHRFFTSFTRRKRKRRREGMASGLKGAGGRLADSNLASRLSVSSTARRNRESTAERSVYVAQLVSLADTEFRACDCEPGTCCCPHPSSPRFPLQGPPSS